MQTDADSFRASGHGGRDHGPDHVAEGLAMRGQLSRVGGQEGENGGPGTDLGDLQKGLGGGAQGLQFPVQEGDEVGEVLHQGEGQMRRGEVGVGGLDGDEVWVGQEGGVDEWTRVVDQIAPDGRGGEDDCCENWGIS